MSHCTLIQSEEYCSSTIVNSKPFDAPTVWYPCPNGREGVYFDDYGFFCIQPHSTRKWVYTLTDSDDVLFSGTFRECQQYAESIIRGED